MQYEYKMFGDYYDFDPYYDLGEVKSYPPAEKTIVGYRWRKFEAKYKWLIVTVAILALPVRFFRNRNTISILMVAALAATTIKYV